MPKIRSITYFANLTPADAEATLTNAGTFLNTATEAFTSVGQIVQTRRFASQPFTPDIAKMAAQLYAHCEQHGIDYLSIGPAFNLEDARLIPDVFRATPGVFASINIADKANGISLSMLQRTAELIDEISRITPDGMTNLYLTAIANCPPGSPFFPVAYHDGGSPCFALAIQAADIAVEAFREADSLQHARQCLTDAIQTTADQLVPVAESLAGQYGIRFGGLDFSLAPYPVNTESLGGALEALGPVFGGAGLVASASLVMNAIEAADFPSVGFSGLMLPILEDSVLAQRAAEGRLTLNDLLLLSAICGTGLDCIPLPGDIGIGPLRDILLDVAALALRLDKPLTARLMPFPGKQAGDAVEFEFEYFADSRVLPAPPTSTLKSTGQFNITPRA